MDNNLISTMRIFAPLAAKHHARAPAKEPFPFKAIAPLKLKNSVSGKGGKVSDVCCIHEMSVLFACLASNEYEQSPCTKEIQSFQKCYKDYTSDKANKFQREMKGLLTPGEKSLTAKQLNVLLKKFPTT